MADCVKFRAEILRDKHLVKFINNDSKNVELSVLQKSDSYCKLIVQRLNNNVELTFRNQDP